MFRPEVSSDVGYSNPAIYSGLELTGSSLFLQSKAMANELLSTCRGIAMRNWLIAMSGFWR